MTGNPFTIVKAGKHQKRNMKSASLYFAIILITMSSFITTGEPATVKDYFGIPGPLQFGKASYFLSWSAHPANNYFKQEYLPANEKPDTYSNMMMIEVATGAIALGDIVKTKLNELEQRKKTDPLCNYQLIQNPKTGEYLLDFIMSVSAGGTTTIAEWNVYRYTKLPDQKGILLFACSKRSYGAAIPSFLRLLKTKRANDVNTLSACSLPAIKIKPD